MARVPLHSTAERGVALVMVLVVLFALLGLAAAIVPLTTVEVQISANHRRAVQMGYAAEAAAEYALQELGGVPDWTAALQGQRVSRLGSARVLRLADGSMVDLEAWHTAGPAAGPVVNGDPADRDWELFLHAPFDRLVADDTGALLHVVVWVSDDAGDPDDDPFVDTNGTVMLHAACFGPAGAQRAVRVTARRREGDWIEAATWQVVR